MTEYALGIDLGTSGVKVGALDLATLRLSSLAMTSYDNSAQQPSTMLWEATAATIRDAVAEIDVRAVKAIGLSGQMHGTVLYNSAGEVIEPVINWQDKRCDAPLERYGGRTTVAEMMAILGAESRTEANWQRLTDLLHSGTQQEFAAILAPEFDDLGIETLASGYLGATLFHIKENDPALFGRIAHVVLPVDLVRGQLLGGCDCATDSTHAASAGIFNVRLNRWHEGVIQRLGLPMEILPAVHSSSEVAGYLPEAVALRLGLAPGTPVIYGGGDNQMSLLGNGLVSGDSPILINIGTGAQISKVTPVFSKVPGIETRSFFNGAYVYAGASAGGGRNYAQLKDQLQRSGAADVSYRAMDALASQVAIGAEGLQYHVRSRSKVHRQEGFSGRTDLDSIGHQARAVLEGVLMDLYMLCPPVDGREVAWMTGAGNALQSGKVWGQMAADFFNRSIKITGFENAVWGAALMAAAGVGAVQDVHAAVETIEYSREFRPDPRAAAAYQQVKAERLECVYCERLAGRRCVNCGRMFCEPAHSAFFDPDRLFGPGQLGGSNAAGYRCYPCWVKVVQELKNPASST